MIRDATHARDGITIRWAGRSVIVATSRSGFAIAAVSIATMLLGLLFVAVPEVFDVHDLEKELWDGGVTATGRVMRKVVVRTRHRRRRGSPF